MKVRDIMSKNIRALSSTDKITKFISLMEKKHIHEALVIDNKKLKGMVNVKSLTKKGILDPSKAKIKMLMMSPPPILSPENELKEAAELLFKTNLRALPVVEKGSVTGIVSMYDIINALSSTKEFRQTKVGDIMSSVEFLDQDTDIGRVRTIMREKNISRLPVVDSRGNLSGIITTFDLLRSLRPRERMNFYSMAAEMDRVMDIPVSTVMNKNPVGASKKDSLNDIFNLMKRRKTSGIVITKGKKPEGIVILKDLLEFYIGGLEAKGMFYQVIGIEGEDRYINNTIERMVKDSIQRLTMVYDPQFLIIHVKKHETGLRSRVKYSVRIRFGTNKGVYISRAWAWDLRTAVNESLYKLERIMFKDREIIRDKIKKNLIKVKNKLRRKR